MRHSRLLVLSLVALVALAPAALAGSVVHGKEKAILESLGLRTEKVINGGTTTFKPGDSFTAVVVDANKLASHGFTGGVRNGDKVHVAVTGNNTFTLSTISAAREAASKGAAAAQGSSAISGNTAPPSTQGATATKFKGANQGGAASAQSLNFTKTFTISGNGQVMPQ